MSLRSGITTGTCAAAAAHAAALVLVGRPVPDRIPVRLPGDRLIEVGVLYSRPGNDCGSAVAAVRKDAGDDPDVTDGAKVQVTLSWVDGSAVSFAAGEGVGMVTRPGLQIPPGEPAINPVPRTMIAQAVREVTPRGVHVEISIPGGCELAEKTFNPRLGIEGGLSILGTSGIVRPYCARALHDAIRCAFDVAAACGIREPAVVPGAIGAKAARERFSIRPGQLIEVGNAWGFAMDQITAYAWEAILVVGHPGKLAKLAVGQWDTHSRRSENPTECVADLFGRIFRRSAPTSPTTEGIFASLESGERDALGSALARSVSEAIAMRTGSKFPVAVMLVGMAGQPLGTAGNLEPWQ